jgi:trimethylamine:corrinoid methyltransferase-like protein
MNFDRWQEQNEPTPLTNAHELARTWLEEVESVLSLEKLLEIKSKFPEIINT